MSLREYLFGRQQEESRTDSFSADFSYDSEELKDLIVRWMENVGWKPQAFSELLERIGVKPPLHLSNLEKEDCSFTCVSGKDDPIGISLRFGDCSDFCPEIWITRGEETNRYEVWALAEKGIERRGRTIKREGKKLESFYCGYFCNRAIYFGDTHVLRVEVHEPEKQGGCNKALRNADAIEAYLMDLEEPVSAQEVYEEVMKLLDFSEEDIQTSGKIMVAYCTIKKKDKEQNETEESRSLVYKNNGKMQAYGILENGETFLVYRNRSWKYISNTAKIDFEAEAGKCNVMLGSTSADGIKHLQISELMERVEARISKLWTYVQ